MDGLFKGVCGQSHQNLESAKFDMPAPIRPFRMLKNGVGLAVKGVRAGVGGTVRLVWPIKKQRRYRKHRRTQFSEHWYLRIKDVSFRIQNSVGHRR